jgi:hypothetical protein
MKARLARMGSPRRLASHYGDENSAIGYSSLEDLEIIGTLLPDFGRPYRVMTFAPKGLSDFDPQALIQIRSKAVRHGPLSPRFDRSKRWRKEVQLEGPLS